MVFEDFTTIRDVPTGDFRKSLVLDPTQYDHWWAIVNVIKFMTGKSFSWKVIPAQNEVYTTEHEAYWSHHTGWYWR